MKRDCLYLCAAVCLSLIGCRAQSAGTPTQPPKSTVAESVCDPAVLLPEVDSVLAGSTFEAHSLTINQQLTLSIWRVDPDLDPQAAGDEVAENARRALRRGAWTAYQVASQVPCVPQVFQAINPMIVDRDYNSWYIDIIPVRALLALDDPTEEEVVAAVERSGAEIAYLRRTTPPLREPVADDACTWSQARADIQDFFGDRHRNAAAYLIVGGQAASWQDASDSDASVQIQWDVSSPDETSKALLLEQIERLSSILACLAPPPDRLEIYVVDPGGRLLVYGLVPGEVVREQASPVPADRVVLRYLDAD